MEGVNGDGGHVVGVLVLHSAGGGVVRAHHCGQLHSLRTSKDMMSFMMSSSLILSDDVRGGRFRADAKPWLQESSSEGQTSRVKNNLDYKT